MKDRSKAIIFDIDGTLLDTADFITSAFQHVISNNSLTKKDAASIRSLIGLPLSVIYKKFAPDFSDRKIEDLCEQHVAFQIQNISLVKIYPHVKDTLAFLHSHNVPMALFTSRRSVSILPTLQYKNIHTFFNVIIGGDHVQAGKPNPEGIKKALDALGVEASHTFMVGDTDYDIMAGKNAHTKTIAVSWGMHGKDVYAYGADFVIDSMQELPPIILDQ